MFAKKVLVYIMSVLLVVFTAGFAFADNLNLLGEKLLGSFLFFDENLSHPHGQSCASCHDPKAGFADPDSAIPVSEGVIPDVFGGRNSPSAAYAAYSPAISLVCDGGECLWIGGQFWDGRASDLVAQAKGPFLNPGEMNNTKEGVIKEVRKSVYAPLFRAVYGSGSLGDVETAYNLVAKAIAAFESTRVLNKFTSKYDWYLKGKVSLTKQEMKGLALFNAPDKGNCAACHPSTSADGVTPPLFTDFSYDNLGVPKNPEIEELIGEPVPVDLGLGVTVNDPNEYGKFKVSSLRNVAKTAPYTHNGFCKSLKNFVHFYNTRDVASENWPEPEYADTVNHDELGNLGLTSREEDDIVAFLLTLTDGYTCKNCR